MADNNEWLVTLRTPLKEKINVFKSDLLQLKWTEILNRIAAACWNICCMRQLYRGGVVAAGLPQLKKTKHKSSCRTLNMHAGSQELP